MRVVSGRPKTIEILGVWLITQPSKTSPTGCVIQVLVELPGEDGYRLTHEEPWDPPTFGHVSHYVHPAGILAKPLISKRVRA